MKARAGVSLVELLFVMAMMGGAGLILLSVTGMQDKMLKKGQTLENRDSQQLRLARHSVSATVIARSAIFRGADAEGNKILYSCLTGLPTCTDSNLCCIASNPPALQSFNFFADSDPALQKLVNTRFSALCPNAAARCKSASNITLSVQLLQTQSLKTPPEIVATVSIPQVLLAISNLPKPIGDPAGIGSNEPSSEPSPSTETSPATRVLFTDNGVFTVPSGVRSIYVTVIGGGGGGGRGTDHYAHTVNNDTPIEYPGGGGSSSCIQYRNEIAVVQGENFAVVVGQGGKGGATQTHAGYADSTEPGKRGETSSFGGFISMPGGLGGSEAYGCRDCDTNPSTKQNYRPAVVKGDYCKGTEGQGLYDVGSRILSTKLIYGNDGGNIPSNDAGGAAPLPNLLGTSNTYGQGGNGGAIGGIPSNYYASGPGHPGQDGSPGVVIVEYNQE